MLCHEIGVRPEKLAFLRDNESAFQLLGEVRWNEDATCPRCNSIFTKQVNTSVFRELTRCLDCGYMFNLLSGTMFQGSKIPLMKYYQLFVAYDASNGTITPREVSYVIDVSDKTAGSMLHRVKSVGKHRRFTHSAPGSASETNYKATGTNSEPFFLYCAMKGILVDVEAFRNFLSLAIIKGRGSS